MNLPKCCKNKSTMIVVYDVGTFGETSFLVCDDHLKQKPFNQFIKSQKKVDENG